MLVLNPNLLSVDGGWAPYVLSSDWSACSVSCGEGLTTRSFSRSCTNPRPQYGGKDCGGGYIKSETKPCKVQDCPGYIIKDLLTEIYFESLLN